MPVLHYSIPSAMLTMVKCAPAKDREGVLVTTLSCKIGSDSHGNFWRRGPNTSNTGLSEDDTRSALSWKVLACSLDRHSPRRLSRSLLADHHALRLCRTTHLPASSSTSTNSPSTSSTSSPGSRRTEMEKEGPSSSIGGETSSLRLDLRPLTFSPQFFEEVTLVMVR